MSSLMHLFLVDFEINILINFFKQIKELFRQLFLNNLYDIKDPLR